jgi:hypothetical protein
MKLTNVAYKASLLIVGLGLAVNGNANDAVGANNGTVNGARLTTNTLSSPDSTYGFKVTSKDALQIKALEEGKLPKADLADLQAGLLTKLNTLAGNYTSNGLTKEEEAAFKQLCKIYLYTLALTYTNKLEFSDDIARVHFKEIAGYAYIRKDKSIISPTTYPYAGNFKNGVAKVWMVDSDGDGSYGYVDGNGHFVPPPENLADRPEDSEVEMQLAVARKIKGVGDWDKALAGPNASQKAGLRHVFERDVSPSDNAKVALRAAEHMLKPLGQEE